jgi:hypothetical protein
MMKTDSATEDERRRRKRREVKRREAEAEEEAEAWFQVTSILCRSRGGYQRGSLLV